MQKRLAKMPTVVITNINDISEDEYNFALTKLNHVKYERVMKYRLYEDKLRSVAADISAKKAVSQITGKDFNSIEILQDEKGKPYFENIYLSLSHSGDYAICAADTLPVGIDIEKIRTNLKNNIARRICTQEDEKNYLNTGDFFERLIEIWTVKEACFKALINQPQVISDIKLNLIEGKLNCEGISSIETKKFKDDYIISIVIGIKI